MPDDHSSAKRRPARPVPLPVEFQLTTGEGRIPGWLTEITLAGALLEPDRGVELPVGIRLRLVVRVLGVDEPLLIRAQTRWDRRGSAGIQFFKLSERDVRVLMELIADAEKVTRNARPTRRLA